VFEEERERQRGKQRQERERERKRKRSFLKAISYKMIKKDDLKHGMK